MAGPGRPKIFHITHVDNLPGIVSDGGLLPDSVLIARKASVAGIGMARIKRRRLALPVACHPGICVGDCVPFYSCPRSIMLFLIHRKHAELRYQGGQEPIVHLELDLHAVAAWADTSDRRWAFTLSNAGAQYAEFRDRLDQLAEIDRAAVASTDFFIAAVKEGKQAELLVHGFVPDQCPTRVVRLAERA